MRYEDSRTYLHLQEKKRIVEEPTISDDIELSSTQKIDDQILLKSKPKSSSLAHLPRANKSHNILLQQHGSRKSIDEGSLPSRHQKVE